MMPRWLKKQYARLRRKLKPYFYSKKDRRHGKVGKAKLWKMKRSFQIEFLKERGLGPRDQVLDLGCGTLRGGIPMIRFLDEGNYFGMDIRKNMIEEAERELSEEGLKHKSPRLIHFDSFSEIYFDVAFDVIWAFSVLIHMSDDILDNCLHFIHRQLKKEGVFYANVNIEENAPGSWEDFPVVHRSEQFYSERAKANGLQMQKLGRLGELGHRSGNIPSDRQAMMAFRKE